MTPCQSRFACRSFARLLLLFIRCSPVDFVPRYRIYLRRLARAQSGDQLNVTVTVILDTIARTPESTAAFITSATNAGATWSNEIRALIERWTETTFSMFEVVDRAVGVQLTLRDLRNGNRYVVDAPDTSWAYPIDSLILSRVIWNSRSYQFAFGTVPVPARDRDTTLALLDEYGGTFHRIFWPVPRRPAIVAQKQKPRRSGRGFLRFATELLTAGAIDLKTMQLGF